MEKCGSSCPRRAKNDRKSRETVLLQLYEQNGLLSKYPGAFVLVIDLTVLLKNLKILKFIVVDLEVVIVEYSVICEPINSYVIKDIFE